MHMLRQEYSFLWKSRAQNKKILLYRWRILCVWSRTDWKLFVSSTPKRGFALSTEMISFRIAIQVTIHLIISRKNCGCLALYANQSWDTRRRWVRIHVRPARDSFVQRIFATSQHLFFFFHHVLHRPHGPSRMRPTRLFHNERMKTIIVQKGLSLVRGLTICLHRGLNRIFWPRGRKEREKIRQRKSTKIPSKTEHFKSIWFYLGYATRWTAHVSFYQTQAHNQGWRGVPLLFQMSEKKSARIFSMTPTNPKKQRCLSRV